MNKTLLIIICDFLLISILALVEFKPLLDDTPVDEQAVRDRAAQDMLELLQLSLEHENQQRTAVEQALGQSQEDLDRTARTLEQTEAQAEALRTRSESLASTLEETRGTLELTLEEKLVLARDLTINEERARRLQEELRAQQDLAARKIAELESAQTNLERLETEQQQLSTQLRIRDAEKNLLEQNLVTARAEVDRARLDAERAQVRAESLATGVSEMAAASTALKEEFRQAQPLSLNAIYQQFADNRVFLEFAWEERLLLGNARRQTSLQSLLVDTGKGVYAVFATANTPLAHPRAVSPPAATLRLGTRLFDVREIGFVAGESGIAAIAVPAELLAASGLTAFPLSADPLRFSTAVLVSDQQELYGEIPIRVPPGESGLLEVESRLFNRLFGEFSPSPGNYVFSLNGELIGLMVHPNRARMLQAPVFHNFMELRPAGR